MRLHNIVCCPQAREGNTRMKTGKGGLAQREALLDSHKHRKQSRKRVHTLMSAAPHHLLQPNMSVVVRFAAEHALV